MQHSDGEARIYYAHRRAEADRAAERIAAERSLSVERETREKIVADLVSQQAAWVVERAALLRDKETAEQELQLAKAQAMDATLLLKEAIEVNTWTQKDLRIRTDQVYELHRQKNSSGTQPPP